MKNIITAIGYFFKQLFSLNDNVVATMMIIVVISFLVGLFLLVKNSMTHSWTIDDVAFSAFFVTFITGGIIKMATDKMASDNKIDK